MQLLHRLWHVARLPAWRRRAPIVGLVIALLSVSSAAASTVTDTDTGHVDKAGTISQVWSINVTDITVPIQASITWPTTAANLNMYLTAPGSTTIVAQTSGTAQPKVINYAPTVPAPTRCA